MTDPVEVEFHLGAPEEVVAHMERLADGSGWITLLPGVLSEHVPPPKSSFLNLFSSGSSFAVPEASWLPPAKPGRPVQIGVRHDHGVKAIDHLVERGHPLPTGWRKAMDHPKRGLVVEVPATGRSRRGDRLAPVGHHPAHPRAAARGLARKSPRLHLKND